MFKCPLGIKNATYNTVYFGLVFNFNMSAVQFWDNSEDFQTYIDPGRKIKAS